MITAGFLITFFFGIGLALWGVYSTVFYTDDWHGWWRGPIIAGALLMVLSLLGLVLLTASGRSDWL